MTREALSRPKIGQDGQENNDRRGLLVAASRKDLLDILASDIRREDRLLPCGVLRCLIQGGASLKVGPQKMDRALLLAATYHVLCACLLSDAGIAQPAVDAKINIWRRQREYRPQRVLAGHLHLNRERPGDSVILPFKTFRFLSSLTPDFVVSLVRWAPSVIGKPDNGDRSFEVLENLLSAFLAAQVIPHRLVWVRVLITRSEARLNVLEVARYAEPLLAPICLAHRDRIIRSAPSQTLAEALTPNLKPAMVARIRQYVPKFDWASEKGSSVGSRAVLGGVGQ